MKLRFLVKLTNDFGFWRLDANNYRIRASVVFRLQCKTYFNERVAMEFVWNEGSGGEWWLGDRGNDVRGRIVDAGYEGRTRRSLKWKCHWRKVKVINGICPSYRVNSMLDAIVAAERDSTYTTVGVLGLFLKDMKWMSVGWKLQEKRWKLYMEQMRMCEM